MIRYYSILFACSVFLTGIAQPSAISLKGLNIDSAGVEKWYDQQIGLENTQLQLGEQERGLFKAQKGHPYFLAKSWTPGSLKYRDQVFEEILIQYNIEEDIMMIRQVDNATFNPSLVKLLQEQVAWFTVDSNRFELIEYNVGQYQPGYFHILFSEDSLRLVVKRTKIIELNNLPTYIPRDDYFIYDGTTYHLIRSKRSIYRVFPQQKKSIRGFIRERHIRIPKMESDTEFVQVMAYLKTLLQ